LLYKRDLIGRCADLKPLVSVGHPYARKGLSPIVRVFGFGTA